MSVKDSELLDIKERTRAKTVFERNVIVTASAGTGKTRLLIDRLCVWILTNSENQIDEDKDNSHIEKAVVLTFTEKASAELKLRLGKKLEGIIFTLRNPENPNKEATEFLSLIGSKWKIPKERILKKCEDALSKLDRAQIGTIHSFASHILRKYSLESNISQNVEVDDGKKSFEVFDREWNKWISLELSENSPDKENWKFVLKRFDLPVISELAQELCNSKYEEYAENTETALFSKICAEKAKSAKKLADDKIAERGKALKNEIFLQNTAKVLEFFAGFFADKSSEIPKEIAELKISTMYDVKGWEEDEKSFANSIVKIATSLLSAEQETIIKCIELLTPFVKRFRAAFNREGFLSYDDILIKARNLLRDNKHVRTKLKADYRNVSIDEFQDTDPVQGEMLVFLCEESGSHAKKWNEVKLDSKGKLFVVGDPKQSIYRFRGADITAYQEFIDFIENQNALHCKLMVNFRSRDEILSSVNYVCKKVIQKENGIQPDYIDLNSPNNTPSVNEKSVDLVLVKDEEDDLNAREGREGQAHFVANWISQNVGKDKKFKFSDIAILIRNMTNLSIYLNALRNSNIPYIVEENRYFYDTPEITDFLNLLKVIDNPYDKISLVGVLRSPLGGASDREIYELAQLEKLNYLDDVPVQFKNAEALFKKLRELNALLGRVSLGELVDKIIGENFVLELFCIAYNGEQSVSNILKMKRIISALSGSVSLGEFIRNSQKYIDKKIKEGESLLADELISAVKILSVHKSKGLEFPVVILADVSAKRQPPRDSQSPRVVTNWKNKKLGISIGKISDYPSVFIDDMEQNHRLAEEARLFYVAITRAQKKLIMVGSVNGSKIEKTSMLNYLSQAGVIGYDFENIQNEDSLINVSFESFKAEDAFVKSLQKPKEELGKISPEIWKTHWKNREADVKTYETTKFVSPSGIGDYKETAKWEEDTSRDKAMLVGTIVHKTLQLHDFKKEFSKEEIEFCINRFVNEKFEFKRQEIFDDVKKILNAFYSSSEYRFIADSEILAREMPFFTLYGKDNSQIMRGIIDIAVKKDGKIYAIDYKTDFIVCSELTKHAETYKPQLNSYKSALGKLFKADKVVSKLVFLRIGKSVEL
jgi:ATP-dependent helicase/nuclease subunit A